MFKRIALFLVTNLAVILVLSIVLRVLGLDRIPIGADYSIPYQFLLVQAAVIGFTGSIISLWMSKFMAKMAMGVKVIEQARTDDERWLFDTVQKLAAHAKIAMPEIGVFESPDPNAFATGARKNAALVAVSTGLLRSMSRDEVEAVLGHEIGHVANGDMVTLALIQGVVNTFVIFLSRVIGFVADRAMNSRDDGERRGPGPAAWIISMVMQVVLGILASMIVAWFSRRREFRADAAGAQLTKPEQMIAALQRLKQAHGPAMMPKSLQAFGIRDDGMLALFASHPPLDVRIAALKDRAFVGQGLPG